MSALFSQLFSQHLASLARVWADEIYADRRTDLPSILSYRELIEFALEVFEELGRALDRQSDKAEIAESARRLRAYALTRFQQGVLIDEVARELTLMRAVLNAFMWREAVEVTGGDMRELKHALGVTNSLIDELLVQSVVVYAANLRPSVRTRSAAWPPQRVWRRGSATPE
jgi:hypothetical protein